MKQINKPRQWPPQPVPLPCPVYDSHTHLDYFPDLSCDYQLDCAVAANVIGVVQVGTDVKTSRFAAKLASRDKRVIAAVAIHPNDVAQIYKESAPQWPQGATSPPEPLPANKTLEEAITEIAQLARLDRVRVIGETGLDYFRTTDNLQRAAQKFSFEEHIQIAKENNLVLQIHDRDAHEDVVRTLLRSGAPERTVMHCFSGDRQMLEVCVQNGWYMSCSGVITFKNAQQIQEVFVNVPKELLLVETDAPFLTPSPFRGLSNSSYMLPHTVRALAAIRQDNLEALCMQVERNAREVFGSW